MTRLEAVEMLAKGYKKLRRFDYDQFDIAIQALMLCDKPEKNEDMFIRNWGDDGLL